MRRLLLGTEHAAALCDGGRIELHWLHAPPADIPESVLLPEAGASPATCLALTNHFCIYGDAVRASFLLLLLRYFLYS